MPSPTAASTASRALLLACGATFLSFLDATVTTIAAPRIATDFDVGVTTMSWVVTAYAIPFAAFLAPAGAIADTVGRARLFRAGVATFTLASLLVSVTPDFGLLLLGRAAQGLGAALLVPASLGLLLAEVPSERRAGAIGLWSAAGALAAVAGPALGGLGVELLGWRALFCLNLPIGVWLAASAGRLVRREARSGRQPDLLGSVSLAAAVAGVVYAVSEGHARGWDDALVVVGIGIAIVAGLLTVDRTRRHPRPALAAGLWRSRPFAVANLLSLCYGATLYPVLLVGVLFTVRMWEYDELRAGLAMTPAALVTALVAVSVGRLPRPQSPRFLVVAGFVTLAAADAILAARLSSSPAFLSVWLPVGVLAGVGTGLATVGVSTAGALSVEPSQFAAATGLVLAGRQLGGAVGVAAMAALLDGASGGMPAYADVYLGAAVLALVAALGASAVKFGPPAPDAAR